MNAHDIFDMSIMPQLSKLVNDRIEDEKTNLDRFVEIFRSCTDERIKSLVINAITENGSFDLVDFHDKVRDAFNLLSHQECCLEKITYMKNFDRTTVEFDVEDPE
jgi:hypothetical protein